MPSLSLFPLDSRCCLLTNMVWERGDKGAPTMARQKLWVAFPEPLTTSALDAEFGAPVGLVRVETAEDDAGTCWRILAEADLRESPQRLSWPPERINNLRVHVLEPAGPVFPLGYYFWRLALEVESEPADASSTVMPSMVLDDRSPTVVEPFAGPVGMHANERLGICHDPPNTDRLRISRDGDGISFESPVFRMDFSHRHARVSHLAWDTYGKGRQTDNLLSTAATQGAFPIVMRDGRRISSESCGGELEVSGRTVAYRGIRPVSELEWNYLFSLNENGFTLKLGWRCEKSFYSSELAALRIPFDLYRTVTSVLAMPDTAGPSGLVALPLVVNAPNQGVMRVTAEEGSAPVHVRLIPWRTRGELWLDIVPGGVPLPSGLFEMPKGQGEVTLEFELTKIFPFGEPHSEDIFNRWAMPPFYSFVDRENVLGALPNAWLTGLSFRPDLGRFANNSVADSAAGCAPYYADIAAYTPQLADGLDPRQMIRFAAEQLLADTRSAAEYSNWRHYPAVASGIIDCAWLYVASSGDWEWAAGWRKEIGYFADALHEVEYRNTGLVVSDYSGIPEEPGYMTNDWCDSVRSGHLVSYANAHVYRGLGRAADLLGRLDDTVRAEAARAMAARLKANFVPTFYDAESCQIIHWVARDGRRFGYRSHFHLGSAVALGLVPDKLARGLLTDYLTRLKDSGFSHYEWGLPIFLDPIPAANHNNWKGKGIEPDGTDQVGAYQNGAIHTHQTFYILQALYKCGMRHEANDLFMKMTPLVRSGGLCGGLHSGLDWRHPVDGRPTGYEGLLAEQFHFLLAAITGYLGCELTIDGLRIDGPDTERIRTLRPNFAR